MEAAPPSFGRDVRCALNAVSWQHRRVAASLDFVLERVDGDLGSDAEHE
jgi:hypothetical protein